MDVRLFAPGAPTQAPRRITIDEDQIDVVRDSPARLVAGPGRPRKLELIDVGPSPVRSLRSDKPVLLYANRFTSDDVGVIREQEWCGLDRTGQLVVSTRDLSVVVGRSGRGVSSRSEDFDLIARLRGHRELEDRSGIRGSTTARLTQLLLEEPKRTWRPTELADLDGLAAPATASRLLAELATLGLVASVGRGRTHDYVILDRYLLGQWLAEQTRSPHAMQTLSCYVRVRDPVELVARLSQRAAEVEARYTAVLTGSAAALIDGAPVTTSIVTASVRIDPDILLSTAMDDFGASPVSSGANVRFIRDVGRVGTLHPRRVRGSPVAGVIRTWLDLRSEPRGTDAAELYWQQVIDADAGADL